MIIIKNDNVLIFEENHIYFSFRIFSSLFLFFHEADHSLYDPEVAINFITKEFKEKFGEIKEKKYDERGYKFYSGYYVDYNDTQLFFVGKRMPNYSMEFHYTLGLTLIYNGKRVFRKTLKDYYTHNNIIIK